MIQAGPKGIARGGGSLTAADIPAAHHHGLVIYDWPVDGGHL